MEEQMARRLVAAEGKKLQQAGLVARTWGNISCRIDENHFVITPSGLDYETMTARDLVLMDIRNGVCCGAHKPSSEKGVHLAAYQTFPEVGYVIHTHQTYATAIGLCGFEQLAMPEEEAEKLGIKTVLNPHPEEGISSSMKLGLLPEADACLFMVADQPWLSADTLEGLICSFLGSEKGMASVSRNGEPGNPGPGNG